MAPRTLPVLYQTSEGHRHAAEPVVYLIHGLSRKQLFSLVLKQRQLLRLMLQVGEAHSQEPDRLFQFDGIQDGKCRSVDFVAPVDMVL